MSLTKNDWFLLSLLFDVSCDSAFQEGRTVFQRPHEGVLCCVSGCRQISANMGHFSLLFFTSLKENTFFSSSQLFPDWRSFSLAQDLFQWIVFGIYCLIMADAECWHTGIPPCALYTLGVCVLWEGEWGESRHGCFIYFLLSSFPTCVSASLVRSYLQRAITSH